MASESADLRTARGLMPGRIVWSFIGAALILVVAVRLMGLVDMPWPLGDPAFRNILTLIFAFIAMATAWVWFVFFSGYSVRARRWTFAGALSVAVISLAMFRLVEVTGSMVPTFAVRWGWLAPDHTLGRLEASATETIDLTTTTADDFPQFLG